MSGIDNIISKIKEENKARIDLVNAERDAKIADINNAANAKLEMERQTITNSVDDEVSTIRSNAVFSAESIGRKQQLAIKSEMLEKSFNGALEQMKAFDDNKKKEYAKKLTVEYADGNEEFVASDAAYSDSFISDLNSALVAAGKAGNLKLVKSNDQIDGFILQKGGVTMDMQYKSVIEDLTQMIDIEVARVLFEV